MSAASVRRRAVLLRALLGSVLLSLSATAQSTEWVEGQVVAVRDGDTLDLRLSRRQVLVVRLHQIDAPERGQPYGRAAQRALAGATRGQRVQLEVVDRDRYGRIVGTLWLDGSNLNAELVAAGLAWAYRQYLEDPHLLELEADARAAGRGLWRDPAPVPPWEWRRRHR